MKDKKGYIGEILNTRPMRFLLIFLALILLFISLKMGIDSLSWKSKRNTDNVLYSYNIKKGYSYAANLTPNEFIDENPQGMNQLYISKLINNFDVVMNYSYSASKPLNLKYQYKIVSSIVGEYHNTPDGEKAEVWVKEFPVTNPVEKTVNNSNSFNIQEKFTVDFHYYDNYVKEFMRQIGVTIDAYLKLELQVTTDGELKDNMNTLHDTQAVTMKIPLNEDVFAISGDSNKNVNKNISGIDTYVEKVNPGKLVACVIMFVISVSILIYVLRNLFRGVKKDEYQSQKDKILKEYGDIIVETTSPVNFSEYQIVQVKNFNEMIDLEEELHVPILYFEPAIGEESWFMLIHDKILYKYVLKQGNE